MPLLESIKYPSNFISSVMFRIERPATGIAHSLPDALRDALRSDFPVVEAQAPGLADHGGWRCASADGKRSIVLSPAGITLMFSSYDTWSAFATAARSVHAAFVAGFGAAVGQRVGLRFVNTIALPGSPFDWSGLITPALTHVFDRFVWEKKEVARYTNQLVFHKGDHLIFFTYGLPNSAFPARIRRKEFLLDIECVGDDVPDDQIAQRLDDYHGEIQSLFESCIEEGLRAMLWGEK